MKNIPTSTASLNSMHVRYIEVADADNMPFGCLFAFEIDLANDRKAYMRFEYSHVGVFDVVIVRADKFLQLWKNYSDDTWEKRRKDAKRNRLKDVFSLMMSKVGYYDYWAAQSDMNNPKYDYLLQLAYENEANWRRFRKFPEAERCFSWGITNPVSLALSGCYQTKSGNFGSGFSNGVTRTIWLLANGAKEFPVLSFENGSTLLLQHAGADCVPSVFKMGEDDVTNRKITP